MDMPETKQSNRRRLKRRHLIYYLRVFDCEKGQPLGHVVNLTVQGMMVISDQPVERDHRYRLCMHLPHDLGDVDTIDFDATSVWIRHDVNPEFYNSGFKFESIQEKDRDILRDLIDRFGLEDVWE